MYCGQTYVQTNTPLHVRSMACFWR